MDEGKEGLGRDTARILGIVTLGLAPRGLCTFMMISRDVTAIQDARNGGMEGSEHCRGSE